PFHAPAANAPGAGWASGNGRGTRSGVANGPPSAAAAIALPRRVELDILQFAQGVAGAIDQAARNGEEAASGAIAGHVMFPSSSGWGRSDDRAPEGDQRDREGGDQR